MNQETGILIRNHCRQDRGDNPSGQGNHHVAIAGFEIETLPLNNQGERSGADYKQKNREVAEPCLKQWGYLVNALHFLGGNDPDVEASFALQLTAIPRHTFGASVKIRILIRVASRTEPFARQQVQAIATSFQKIFPKGDLKYPVLVPIPLGEAELKEEMLHNEEEVRIVTINKFVEHFRDTSDQSEIPVPHPFFSDPDSSLLFLIEELERAENRISLRIEIAPVRLNSDEEEYISLCNHIFARRASDSEKQLDLIAERGNREQFREKNHHWSRDWSDLLAEQRQVKVAKITPYQKDLIRRGEYVYRQFYESQTKLFTLIISLACTSGRSLSASTIASVLSVLSVSDAQDVKLGWGGPVVSEPDEHQHAQAVENYKWMLPFGVQLEEKKRRWHSLATLREILPVFHLPALDGPTVGIETASVPFYVTAELLKKMETVKGEKQVVLGYLYHSQDCYDPETVGLEKALPFRHPIALLNRPTLVSGAPGGGKSNWLFSLLIDLWKEYQMPWCVIDPSGGQEYRYLLVEESLKDQLVIYTIGDNLTMPFRFNPFSLPPSGLGGSNTVRSHAARLLSCFKSASDMWTPLPEIFQEAICRVYRDFGWLMDDTYETGIKRGLKFPSFKNFAQALDDQVTAQTIPNYGFGTEAAGILLGGTRDRVNSIVNQLGHILDESSDSSSLFQNLLRTPCVLELGSLGSEDTIALVMSFLLVQIAGHTEYTYRMGYRKNQQHLLCVEEAHIVLSNESPSSLQGQQGNPRGKAAEDFGRMLLEFRKFGCGIVLIDQRIASLIGSAIDSAYLNLMFRTVSPASFNHLKTILNLDARQTEYAHTKLDEGRSILLDRSSGMPVLIRQRNVLDNLKQTPLSFDAFIKKVQENAKITGLEIFRGALENMRKPATPAKKIFRPQNNSDNQS